MLKPRRANMLVTRMSAPGLFSTRTEMVCFIRPAPLLCVSWNSTMSSAAAPAGIIGKQCSRGSTRASTTHVRPEAIASVSAASSSSSFSAVKPSAPYARASAA